MSTSSESDNWVPDKAFDSEARLSGQMTLLRHLHYRAGITREKVYDLYVQPLIESYTELLPDFCSAIRIVFDGASEVGATDAVLECVQRIRNEVIRVDRRQARQSKERRQRRTGK